jgi:cell division protein FtsI/penicillin-binding protein 2
VNRCVKMGHGFAVRTNLVFSAFLLGAACLAAHLFFLQFNPQISTYYVQRVEERWHSYKTPQARRGKILFRDGSLIAGNEKAARVIVEPELVAEQPEYLDQACYTLAANLNLLPEEIREKITNCKGRGLVLAEGVPVDTALKIDRQSLRGVFTRYYYERVYPYGVHSAAATVGYAGKEPFQRLGLESTFDEQLTGKDGLVVYRKDADRKHLPGSDITEEPCIDGEDITTTLHPAIQLVCEDELRNALAKNQSKWGCVLVLDPDSGEVLGAATAPTFDPNEYVKGNLGPETNYLVHSVFEPGSTVKPLVAAYGIDQGWLSADKRYVCNQTRQINGYRIREAEASHGVGGSDGVPISQIIVKSSNIGMAQVALEMGQQHIMQCFTAFGFFNRTGVELPNESAGLEPFHYAQRKSKRELKWPAITLANTGFGQGLSVTPMQLAAAYCVIANGGYRVQPTLILDHETQNQPDADPEQLQLPGGEMLLTEFVGDDPLAQTADEEAGRVRVLSREACQQAQAWLAEVVADGTGTKAQLERYPAAGKTGTAQIYSEHGGYRKGVYNALFAGFFPVDQPRYVILVIFSEPQGGYYGGEVAAPVFKAIGDRISYIDELGLTEAGHAA